MIADNVTQLVGNTPLVRINRLARGAEILAKLEAANPGGSVKDRVGTAIIEAARASGKLAEGGTIVEASSGNTGIALAMAGAAAGYRVVITMPESMSRERRALMRAYGAEIVLTDAAKGMQGTVDEANRIVASRPGAVLASQFTNPANPHVHARTTAREILADTGSRLDYFVAGVGTGGTVTGVGSVLKAESPATRVIAVEPAESPLLSGGKAGPHGIQGIGANFVPQVYDPKVVDEVVQIATPQALKMARAAARREGLLVGISSGAALAAAVALAAKPAARGKRIVVILPDTGERYLSSPLFAGADEGA